MKYDAAQADCTGAPARSRRLGAGSPRISAPFHRQDQLDWMRMKDYTWQARSIEKHLDSHGKVQSTKRETWETLILDGQPFRRILERDGKRSAGREQEQKKLDQRDRKLSAETPAEKQRRMEEFGQGAPARVRIPFRDTRTIRPAVRGRRPPWTGGPSGWSPARPARRAGQEQRRQNAAQIARPHVDRQGHLPMGESGSRDHRHNFLGLFLARLNPGVE